MRNSPLLANGIPADKPGFLEFAFASMVLHSSVSFRLKIGVHFSPADDGGFFDIAATIAARIFPQCTFKLQT